MAEHREAWGPSRGAFCQCGWETPVVATSTTALDAAEHDVHHFEWAVADGQRVSGPAVLAAYRSLVVELRAFQSRQRRRIVDLEETVAALEWDVKVRDDLVEDLKADLAAVEEGRHV